MENQVSNSNDFNPISPTLNGLDFSLDIVTGYLAPSSGFKLLGFSIDKKLRFIELCRLYWPNVGKICKAVEISRTTFLNHFQIDKKFRDDINAIKEDHLDELEAVMMENGKRPSGFMDRIATLKADRGAKWNLDHNVQVTHTIASDEAESRKRLMTNIVEGEIVKEGGAGV